MKNFFISVPKVLFAVLCYLCALILAFLSGYFTVVFYAESQTGWNMWVLGSLAAMLEFIKIMLAISFPFIKHRDQKLEKKVSFYLKICFFLSIMASLNFFMSGGDIERSPASTITQLLYNYIPIFNIIPLKFSQFITTMSLSILVEAFIIFLPILAPIMFFKKSYYTKNDSVAVTNMEKLKEIICVIPDRLIDNLHKKVVGDEKKEKSTLLEYKNNNSIKVIEMKDKPKLKLLKNNFDTNLIESKKEENELKETKKEESIENIEDEIIENSEEKIQKLLAVIYKYKNSNICPSVRQLIEYTSFSKSEIHKMKKTLEQSGILKTQGSRTFLLCDYDDALGKIWA